MWTVVYIAPNKKEAEKIQQMLLREGLLVKLRFAGLPPAGDGCAVEILVPELEADEALEIISSP